MARAYTDLKKGDVVTINPGALEIRVLDINEEFLKIENYSRRTRVFEGTNLNMGDGISLHNYGTRNRIGKNVAHVGIVFRRRGIKYSCVRQRGDSETRMDIGK